MNEKRRLSGIMFTDVVGYSAIMDKNESAAMKLLENHKNITKPIIENYNGKILKPQGDGFMIEFSSVVDAVRCGTEIQKGISDYNNDKNEDEKIKLRIGIHMGDLIIKDNDIYGHDVNIASRVEGFSPEGGISISDKVYKDIQGVKDIKTSFIGHRKLKGVEQETKIRCITSDELPKHRKQIFPLIIGYYTMILGGLNAFLILALIIYSGLIGFKLHFMWMCAFIIDFTLIFIGYSCLSYVRGVSIKAQRFFLYLGYFIILSIILSALAMTYDFLFYLPAKDIMLPF